VPREFRSVYALTIALVPPVEDGARDEDRGEGSGQHAVDEDLAVEADVAGAEDPEGHGAEEDRRGGQDRTGKACG
jgi:hypothetical protein